MKKPSEYPAEGLDPQLRDKIIGLGERSFKKSYYPELMRGMAELEQFRPLLVQSKDAVFLLLIPDGRVVDANEMACRYLDLPAHRIQELTYRDFLSAQSATQLETLVRHGVEKSTFPATLRGSCEIPVEVTMKVAVQGSDHYAVLVARDITERLEDAANVKRLTTAVEQAANAIVVTEPDGNVIYGNPAFDTFTGYPNGFWTGRNLREVLSAGRPGTDEFPDIKGLGNEFPGWRGNIEYLRADGQTNQAEVSISPVRDDSGMITSMVVIASDITEEVRLERLLRQSQRMEALGALAGGIAHDFNNILIPIVACSELIRPHLPEGSRAHEYLDSVVGAAERARDLIRQIRTFSHNDQPQLRAVSLRRLIREVMQLLRSSAREGIVTRDEFKTDKDVVLADPSQLYQVLLNLCTNAIQAMQDQGGTMTLSVEEVQVEHGGTWEPFGAASGTYLKIDVRDTGPGIAPQLIDKVFDPLFTTRSDRGGTGLGLSLVYDIVRKHGGWIVVSSDPGRGALFSVFLRWAADHEDDERREGGERASATR